ncbi:hypothetical protein C1645_779212 [Glomus cerebriforme]|uniref:Uncharacterized protein n=1 Tax=Glomus cerebriforme TaxID=658196 RepID=A0A397SKK9_9GLOM|nr:hypothetical protein C1645_779212 [Glomus cerebriforme]
MLVVNIVVRMKKNLVILATWVKKKNVLETLVISRNLMRNLEILELMECLKLKKIALIDSIDSIVHVY